MSKCPGLHCGGCGDGGGWGALAAVVAIVVIGAAVARPLEHAADVLLHIVFIIVVALAATTVASVAGYAAWRIRRSGKEPAAKPLPQRVVRQVQARRPREIPAAARREVHQHLHLHGVSAPDFARSLSQQSADYQRSAHRENRP